MSTNSMKVHHLKAEPWKVTLVDTGADTQTGGRLKRVANYIDDHEPFCFTYGDGVCDIHIGKLLDFHRSHGKLGTITAVHPPGRFGALEIQNQQVVSFKEKPRGDGGMINGGFFVLSSQVLSLLKDDQTIWESTPLETLTSQGQLAAYQHEGFWQPMDTLRDKTHLEDLWAKGSAPWKVWS
jgi:glucose-1-phosphate cytidylyltransferase